MKTDDSTLWKNLTPSAPCYCRSIQFEFTKETTANTLKVYDYYNKGIEKLRLLHVTIDDMNFEIKYGMTCTMMHGKVSNVLCERTASSWCNICDAPSSEMKYLELVRNFIIESGYLYLRLHPLHYRIRFLDHIELYWKYWIVSMTLMTEI